MEANKYSPKDMLFIVEGIDIYDPKGYTEVTGFEDEPYTSPRMWHKAEKLDNGNWKVSVTHKFNRVIVIELSDETYKKSGIADLKPSVVNPFGVNYDDSSLETQ